MVLLEYLLYVSNKEQTSFNGIEYFVFDCIQKRSTKFLPGTNTIFLSKDKKEMSQTKPQGEQIVEKDPKAEKSKNMANLVGPIF